MCVCAAASYLFSMEGKEGRGTSVQVAQWMGLRPKQLILPGGDTGLG